MEVGYFARAALLASYMVALGQISPLPQTPHQNIQPKQGLERKVNDKQSTQNSIDMHLLHSQLLRDISDREEELLPASMPCEDVCYQTGFLVYDGLAKLAHVYKREISLDNLCVYAVNDAIIVENRNRYNQYWHNRLVLFPNNTAIEVEDFFQRASGVKLKIKKIGGKEVLEEVPFGFDKKFPYIPDMDEYDFSVVYSRVSGLQKLFNRLRMVDISYSTYGTIRFQVHPVDGVKFRYFEEQIKFIAEDLLGRYGINLYDDGFNQSGFKTYSTVDTYRGLIRIYQGGMGYYPDEKGYKNRTVIIRDRPEATSTTTIMSEDGFPMKILPPEILLPVKGK